MSKLKVSGKVGEAVIYTVSDEKTAVDDYALAQIKLLCVNEVSRNSKIRVMPDVHPSKVSTVGLTMTVGERMLPCLVGIDIGCGVTMARLNKFRPEYQRIDKVIRENISTTSGVRNKIHPQTMSFDFDELFIKSHINKQQALQSLGTLGYGNHFFEIDVDDEGNYYVSVHSGSRHLGKEVAEYYLAEGQRKLKARGEKVPYELTYLTGELMTDYLHDIQVVQKYAYLNRMIIIEEVSKIMKWKIEEVIDCIHNYVDFRTEQPILRKGAISAKEGELVIIPINMRDGVIVGRGKGNTDWNDSAPHGAGRILKRVEVQNQHTLSEFKSVMKGIYSTSITKDTLDESPFAYRGLADITEAIADTVEIDKILRPVYNFKAGSIKG